MDREEFEAAFGSLGGLGTGRGQPTSLRNTSDQNTRLSQLHLARGVDVDVVSSYLQTTVTDKDKYCLAQLAHSSPGLNICSVSANSHC